MKSQQQLLGGIMVTLTLMRFILGRFSLSLTEENLTTKLNVTVINPSIFLNVFLPSYTLKPSFRFTKEFCHSYA